MAKGEVVLGFEKYRGIAYKILESINQDRGVIDDLFQLLLNMRLELDFNERVVRDFAMRMSHYGRDLCLHRALTLEGDEMLFYNEKYWQYLWFEAPTLLDSYCLYIEKNRPPQERFYEPRRKTLKQVVDKLQMLEDDLLDELFVHQPARTGKTGIMSMGMTWHISRNMEISNLYVTHKGEAAGAFIDGVAEFLTDPTYCHSDVFPNARIVSTNAKAHTLDLGRRKKYKSLSGAGMDAGLNGLYDATGWLLADDVLAGIEDVLNPEVLSRKRLLFDNNVMNRRKQKCKIIYNGTIWSLYDIYMDRQAFLESNPDAKRVRWDILKIPALDPITDESNFDYDYGVGFDTKYYHMVRAKFLENNDNASWLAQYQQEPIERDGEVFAPEGMNFYNGVLPDKEPVKILAACDVALGGSDFLSMPIAVVYDDGAVYIPDVVFDNGEKHVTQPKVVGALIRNGVTNGFFEANNGGEGYKDEISRMLEEQGIYINLTSKFSQQMIVNAGKGGFKTHQRKEQRIWDNAQTIREFYFLDEKHQNAEYRRFMNQLYSFTINGKNKHEDAPDSLAMLAVFLNKGSGTKITRIINSPI